MGDEIDFDRLKKIMNLTNAIEKRLRELVELENTLRFLSEYIECDPYTEECYSVSWGEKTKKLEDFLRLYHLIEKSRPEKLISEVKWYYDVAINYERLELVEICRKENCFDCIEVKAKLPLSEDDKKAILERVRERIKQIVLEELPEDYIKAVLTVASLTKTVAMEVRSLQHDYDKLECEFKELARRIARG